jgi:hypothetical protein
MKLRVMRSAARLLARHAASVAPHPRAGWGNAMQREVEHIEDDAEALGWAFGCVLASYEERAMHLSKPVLIILRMVVAGLIGVYALSQLPIVLMVWGYKAGNFELAAATDGVTAGDDFHRFVPLMDQMSWLQLIGGGLQCAFYLCAVVAIVVGWRRAPLLFAAGFLLQVAGWLSTITLPAFQEVFGNRGLIQDLVIMTGLTVLGAATFWLAAQRPHTPPSS